MTTNILFPAPGSESASIQTDNFTSTNIPSVGKLEIYYSPSYSDVGLPTYINSQYNVAYDVAKYYTYDSDFLTSTIRTPFITQTLYFNNVDSNGSILYRKNTDIRIIYLGNGFSKIVTVKDATKFYITFDIYDGFPIVNTSGLRLTNVLQDTAFSTTAPSTTLKFPAPGATTASKLLYDFNDFKLPAVSSNLSWFDNISNETSDPINISGQFNLKYNIVDWYIKESVLLTSTSVTPIDTQTLYFNNTLNGGLRFRKDHTVKISYDITGFSATVQIISADVSSITFNLVNGFPTSNQGGLRIVLVTMEVYTRDIVKYETLKNKGIRPLNITTARENLFVVESAPNMRGVPFSYNQIFAGLSTPLTQVSLPTHTSLLITGDNSFAITSQTVDVATNNTTTVNWYINENDILTYTLTTNTTKTVYFATQSFVPFPTGSVVRIRNFGTLYSNTFTVLLGTYNSVSLDHTETFPTDGTYIDDFTTTVYKQSDVYTTVSPTNARENLYYFNMSPGLRSSTRVSLGTTEKLYVSQIAKPMTKVVADQSTISLSLVTKLKQAPSVIFNTPTSNSLSKAIVKLKDTTTIVNPGQLIKPIVQLKSPIVVSVAASVKNFTTAIKEPVRSTSTVAKVSFLLKLASANPVITVSQITKTTISKTVIFDASTLSGNVNKFTTVRSQIFTTPNSATLSKQLFRLNSDKTTLTSATIKLRNTMYDYPNALKTLSFDSYKDQRTVTTNIAPTNAAENYFYSLLSSSRARVGAEYPTSRFLNNISFTSTVGLTDNSTTPTLPYLSVTGMLAGINYFKIQGIQFSTVELSKTNALSNFDYVPDSVSVTVTGQTAVYDVLSWYIYENQIITSSTPTPGVTTKLTFNNSSLTTLFYANTYVRIDQVSSNYSVIAQVLSSTLTSITISTISGFPTSLTGITITRLSNPVYSRTYTASQLAPYGIVQQTTLPRENLYAVETYPNLRGVRVGFGRYLTASTATISSNRLEVFQDPKLYGDFRLPSYWQSSDASTTSNNIVNWYIYESNTVSTTTAVPATKTIYFAKQDFAPFMDGSIVKISSDSGSATATVITGTTSYVVIAEPAIMFSSNNFYIERTQSTVYDQLSVVTNTKPTSARENLYYSILTPMGKNYVKSINTPLAVGSVKMPNIIKGDSVKLATSSMRISVKVNSDNTILSAGLTTTKIIVKSTEKATPLVSITATPNTPTITWSNPVTVTGLSGITTTPTVQSWYTYDADIIKSLNTAPSLVTLYVGSMIVGSGGEQIRVIQTKANYDRTFTVVSYTAFSVTISNPYDLPTVSGMYLVWGRTSYSNAITYSNTNTVPLVDKIKPFVGTVFANITSGVVSKQLSILRDAPVKINVDRAIMQSVKVVSDNTVIAFGSSTTKMTIKSTEKAILSREVLSTSTSTPVVTWNPDPVYVTGITGVSTTPTVQAWYTYDADIIQSITTSASIITLYVSSMIMGLGGEKIRVIQPSTNYDRIFTVMSYTAYSVTISNPYDLKFVGLTYFIWGRTTTTTSVTYTNPNPVPFISPKVQTLTLFDAPVSNTLSKQLVKLTNDRTVVNSGVITLNRILRGIVTYPSKSTTGTTSTTSFVWDNNPIYVYGRSGYTSNTSSWYTYDSDVLSVTYSNPGTITLYLGPVYTASKGEKIRIIHPYAPYDMVFTEFSYNETYVTIQDPGNFPTTVSGMFIIWGRTTTSYTTTYGVDNTIPIISKFKSLLTTSTLPSVSVLAKQLMVIKDVPVKLSTDTAKMGVVKLIADRSYRSTELATTTVTPITTWSTQFQYVSGSSLFTTTPSVQSWYTYDADIIQSIKSVSPYVTLYTASWILDNSGDKIRVIQPTTNYDRTFTVISYTANSVTFDNPYDLPNILTGMYFIWGRVSSTTFVTYTNTNSIPVISKIKPPVMVTVNPPTMSVLAKQLMVIKDAPVKLNVDRISTNVTKLIADRTVLVSGNTRALAKIASPEIRYASRSVSSTSVKQSTSWSSPVYVVGISGNTTTPTVQSWYTYDADIITSSNLNTSIITLYFDPSLYSKVNASTIRVMHTVVPYSKIFTIISYTNNTVTISNPYDLPSISGMYFSWGSTVTAETVTYTNTNQTSFISKVSSAVYDTVKVPASSVLSMKTMIKGEPGLVKTAKLETFDNVGVTANSLVSATQSNENIIPITGITSSYTNNVVSWYTNDLDILTTTALASPTNLTVYFTPNNYTIGSTVTLVKSNFNYKTISVISSTANSITFANYPEFPGISNLYIYISTTLYYNVSYPYTVFSSYVKLSTSASTETQVYPVISSNPYSVTFVKTNPLFNTTVSSTMSVSIDDASPAVYPFWQQSTVSYSAHDRYRTAMLVSNGVSIFKPVIKTGGLPTNNLNVGKASSAAKLAAVQTFVSKAVSGVTTTSKISWSTDQLYVVGRTGFSTTPTISDWYIRDDLYNTLATTSQVSSNVTLFLNTELSVYSNYTKIRIVNLLANFDRIIDIISITFNTVTIALPENFPSISGMFVYFGTIGSTESVSYTTTNFLPYINKTAISKVGMFETPVVGNARVSLSVRADKSNVSLSLVKQFKTLATNTQVFNAPTTGNTRITLSLKADNTPVFRTSKVTQTSRLVGEPAQISARRLETFYNIRNVVENLTPVLSSSDTSILLAGRSPTAYTSNVVNWYIYDYDKLTVTPSGSVPTNITLYFNNTTGLTVGSTVTLVQYALNYFKTIPVISSTSSSITILNDNIPLSELYIYFGTTLSFAPTYSPVFLPGTTATILNNADAKTYNVQVVSSSKSSLSFVKTFAFDTANSSLTLYNSDLPYYPMSSVVVTGNVPTNARENLMAGMLTSALRSKSYATVNNIGPAQVSYTSGAVRRTFKLAGDVSYASRELKSTSQVPVTRWAVPMMVTGIQRSTANTASWYTYDSDILTTTVVNPTNITLYFGAPVLLSPLEGLPVRIVQDLYVQSVTVISYTTDSITIVNPNLPNRENFVGLAVQVGYYSTDTTVTYTDNTNTSLITKFNAIGYAGLSTPTSANIKQQLFSLITTKHTLTAKDSVKSFTVKNTAVLNAPVLSTTKFAYTVKPIVSNLDTNNIPYKAFRADGLYTNTDYITDQRYSITNKPPVTPTERLFYTIALPGKYGTDYFTNKRVFDIKSLLSSGNTESLTQNSDLFAKLFPTGIISQGLGQRVFEVFKEIDFKYNIQSLSNYYNIPTDISVGVFNQNQYNTVPWYIYDADILSSTVSPSGLTQILRFSGDLLFKKFNNGDLIKLEQQESGFSVTATIIDSSYNTITINTIPNYPIGAIKVTNLTTPVYSKDFTYSQLISKGIIRQTTLPRENLFAAESQPNLRGVQNRKELFNDYTFKSRSGRLEVFSDVKITGDFRILVSLQTPDVFTTSTNAVDWYTNDKDILSYLTGVSSVKTFYFAQQDAVPFPTGSVIRLTNDSYTNTFTVLIGTTSSVTIAQPSELIAGDGLYIQRTTASVYPSMSAWFSGAPTNSRENLFASLIAPRDRSNKFMVTYSDPTSTRGAVSVFNKLKGDSTKLSTNAVSLSVRVNAADSKSFTVVSKVILPNILKSVRDNIKTDSLKLATVVKSVDKADNFKTNKLSILPIVRGVESYPSREAASSTTSTSLVWSTTPVYISGISGFSTNPTVDRWYSFDKDLLSVIDSKSTYITLYFAPDLTINAGSTIQLVQPFAGYSRVIPVVSYTSSSVTILNTFDFPSISNMYFYWGKNVTTTTVAFTNNNTTPRINIFKSMNASVLETPTISNLSKQLVKLVSDTNRYKISTGVSFTVLRSDNGYLSQKPVFISNSGKGLPYAFSDTVRILVDSRGRIDKFITSNYQSIMNGQAVQKKETIQFWN